MNQEGGREAFMMRRSNNIEWPVQVHASKAGVDTFPASADTPAFPRHGGCSVVYVHKCLYMLHELLIRLTNRTSTNSNERTVIKAGKSQ